MWLTYVNARMNAGAANKKSLPRLIAALHACGPRSKPVSWRRRAIRMRRVPCRPAARSEAAPAVSTASIRLSRSGKSSARLAGKGTPQSGENERTRFVLPRNLRLPIIVSESENLRRKNDNRPFHRRFSAFCGHNDCPGSARSKNPPIAPSPAGERRRSPAFLGH